MFRIFFDKLLYLPGGYCPRTTIVYQENWEIRHLVENLDLALSSSRVTTCGQIRLWLGFYSYVSNTDKVSYSPVFPVTTVMIPSGTEPQDRITPGLRLA